MSYDIYCYRSASDLPDRAEAAAAFDRFNAQEELGEHVTTPEMLEKILAALMQHDPRLERFQSSPVEVGDGLKISDADAMAQHQHAELNTAEGDLSIQLAVYGDTVAISVPYSYSGPKADELFQRLSAYLSVIRQAAGLFAYDPQTDVAFDPVRTPLIDHHRYDEVAHKAF